MNAQSSKPEPRDFTIRSVKAIVAHERTGAADTLLGMALTFVAGAINAGGFLVVGQYTSHMSGILSGVADNLALGSIRLVGFGLMAFLPFVAGAACSAMLINWGRRHHLGSRYAMPLMLEAFLLLGFGILGWLAHPSPAFVTLAVPLLCFIMGLQNATVTKISGARMRTTHVTGIVTDIGIELGKFLLLEPEPGQSGPGSGGPGQAAPARPAPRLLLHRRRDRRHRVQPSGFSVRPAFRAPAARARRASPGRGHLHPGPATAEALKPLRHASLAERNIDGGLAVHS